MAVEGNEGRSFILLPETSINQRCKAGRLIYAIGGYQQRQSGSFLSGQPCNLGSRINATGMSRPMFRGRTLQNTSRER